MPFKKLPPQTVYKDDDDDDMNDEKLDTIEEDDKNKTRITRSVKDPPKVIRIKEFDFNTLSPLSVNDKNGVKIVVIGKPGSGKSTIVSNIIASKAHIIPVAQIFSGTEDSNGFYSSKFPGICVFNKLDLTAVENFVRRQKIAIKHLPNPWAVQVLDDVTENPSILTSPLFQSYYKNGRHWKMLHILSLQYCMDIKPVIRQNIDYTFILRESNGKFRKKLHENYAGCIEDYKDFCDIMDQVTEDYTALVICNRVQSNQIEDCVFWYKGVPENKMPPNWKFGATPAWKYHHQRFDPQYTDPII